MPHEDELEAQLKRLNALKIRREKLFSQTQRFHDICRKLTAEDVSQYQPRYEKLTSLEGNMDEIQLEIIEFNANLIDDSYALEINQVQNAFDDLLFATRGRFLNLMKAELGVATEVSHRAAANNHLPHISIPIFSGRIEEWTSFYSLFESVVNNNTSLTDAEKFQYLRSYLKGDALAVISNFHMTDANYSLAYQALQQRYQNKRRLATFYVNQIREFTPLTSANYSNLQNFLNVHSNSVNALKALKLADLSDFLLFHLSLCNLDSTSRKAFENKQSLNVIPEYEDLINYVIEQSRTSEMLSQDCKVNKNKPSAYRQTNSFLANAKPSILPIKAEIATHTCPLCKCTHALPSCNEFLRLSVDQKYEAIKKLRRCFNCLGAHSRNECQSRKSCRSCNISSPVEIPSSSYTQTLSCQISDVSNTVLLGTVQVLIQDSHGTYQPIRAVIDPGSQISAITSAFAQRLGFRLSKSLLQIVGIGNTSTKNQGLVQCTLRSKYNSQNPITTEAVVLSHITNKLPSIDIPATVNLKFQNLNLADNNFWRSSRVDFLIGANLYPHILCAGTSNVLQGNPSAINTLFGWVVMGGIANENVATHKTALLTVSDSLNDVIQQFWETEEVTSSKISNPEDDFCEIHFSRTHYRQSSGRYVVSMPFRPSHTTLSNNRKVAFKSYLNLENRFTRRPEIASQYNDFLKEYLRLSHIELAVMPSTYVLPHHCVCKPTSTTTKIRVVFNASAPDATGVSLNQRLLPGPKLQNDLANIVLSFRFHHVALCADIKMMYRQILLDPDQRNLQHIFWRCSQESSIQEYQLNTLTYSLSPSAYLAQRVIKQLVDDEGTNIPLASKALLEHTYVDDIVTGASSLSEAIQLQSNLIKLLGRGGFQLRKWASNDPEALRSFPPDHLETPLIFSKNELAIKILGLMWDPNSDVFTYHVLSFDGPITKRSVLSYIARIFDHLGWLTPVVFWTKHFMQQLWTLKLEWDEALPDPLHKLWIEYTADMHLLTTIKIPRKISQSFSQNRLVGFCDASEKGTPHPSIYITVTLTLTPFLLIFFSKQKEK